MPTLEERLAALEERVGMESGLRASQDRDIADLAAAMRSTRALVQAVAITQSEMMQRMDHQDAQLLALNGGVSQILRLLERIAPQDNEG